MLMAAASVSAQTATATEDRGYVQAVAESAFGNVTSQSYGAEAGFTVRPDLQIFGSFGHVGNVATDELSAAAQSIAGALSQLQSGTVSYSVNEPATFFAGGVRYRFQVASVLKPYVSEANHWMMDKHGVFQGYYFFHHIGLDRDMREQFRGHPHFEYTAQFCHLYDQNSFDPGYDSMPLDAFEPMLRRVLETPRRSIYKHD